LDPAASRFLHRFRGSSGGKNPGIRLLDSDIVRGIQHATGGGSMSTSSSRTETTGSSARAVPARGAIPSTVAAVGRYRWTICWLLFVATTINYIDRNVVSILKQDVLIGKLGWTEADYGNVFAWFSLSYAVMMIITGRIIDRIGLKLGFAAA